jgi:hypothetical protein
MMQFMVLCGALTLLAHMWRHIHISYDYFMACGEARFSRACLHELVEHYYELACGGLFYWLLTPSLHTCWRLLDMGDCAMELVELLSLILGQNPSSNSSTLEVFVWLIAHLFTHVHA